MIPVACLVVALNSAANSHRFAVEVVLQPDVDSVKVGDPVLVKVRATNRAAKPLNFTPPLGTLYANLAIECQAPKADVFSRIRLTRLTHTRPALPGGWTSGATYVSYTYFFRDPVAVPQPPRTPPGTNEPELFHTEGDWRIRAVVIAGGTRYYSAPVTIRVRGSHLDPEKTAIGACAEGLQRWFGLPNAFAFRDAAEAESVVKLLPDLAGTAVERPLRQRLLLDEICSTPQLKIRRELVARWRDDRATLSPLQREYADLLLGIAHVRCKDYAAARELLRDIREPSDLRGYIVQACETDARRQQPPEKK